jgi:pimeloyl-ACP methyl ester carboxylesterase
MSKAIDCAYLVDGQGPALVMVHGIGARKTGWDKVTEALKDSFTCIRYDLRGHGDSPLPSEDFGLDELVEDLEALRARLGIEQMHIIGHSLGGMIGPAYAHKYPQHVLSIGLLSTAAFRSPQDSENVRKVVRAMEEKGIGPVLDTLTQRWFTESFCTAHPEVIEWRKQQVMATPAAVFLNVFHIYAETEMAPWLHEVTQPCLVLTGEFDGGCNPVLNRQIAEALPHSELVVLPDLKHAILIEASDKVVPHLKAFLQKASQ